MTAAFSIAGRRIGAGQPVYIIAELSANHRQHEDVAIQLVHAAHEAGADAVKLQTYTPDTITIASSATSFRAGSG
jgi:pseudaminic acid synthase